MYIIVSSNKFWTGMISPGNSDKDFQDSQKDQNSRNSRMHEYHEIVSRQMSFRVFPKAKRISKTIVSFNLIKHKLISRFHFLRNSSPFRKYRFNRIYSLTHLIGWFRLPTQSRARQYLNAHKINLCQINTRDITRYHSVIFQVSYKIFYWVRNSKQTKQLLILLLATINLSH